MNSHIQDRKRTALKVEMIQYFNFWQNFAASSAEKSATGKKRVQEKRQIMKNLSLPSKIRPKFCYRFVQFAHFYLKLAPSAFCSRAFGQLNNEHVKMKYNKFLSICASQSMVTISSSVQAGEAAKQQLQFYIPVFLTPFLC
jgi:hypothetical protein